MLGDPPIVLTLLAFRANNTDFAVVTCCHRCHVRRRVWMTSQRDPARYESRAAIVKALACPARLMIVDELAECGERSVQELTAMIGTDGSTVSRHLSTLKNAGVVASRKSGTTVYYRLRMKCIPAFLKCVESMLREDAEMKAHV